MMLLACGSVVLYVLCTWLFVCPAGHTNNQVPAKNSFATALTLSPADYRLPTAHHHASASESSRTGWPPRADRLAASIRRVRSSALWMFSVAVVPCWM